ncbi:MAG: L,D-transpeptidase, partial [Myxococcota bacterium]
MRQMHSRSFVLLAVAAWSLSGCDDKHEGAASAASASASAIVAEPVSSARPDGVDLEETSKDVPVIGAKGLFIMVRDRPSKKRAKELGYLRLGSIVERSEEQVKGAGCKGGWYKVEPRGYACLDKDGTLDRDHPVLRAANRRPDLNKPMPYAYGFVRAVLPLYLKIPTAEEQYKSEFKLE